MCKNNYKTSRAREDEDEKGKDRALKTDEAIGAAMSDVEVGGRRSCEPFRAPIRPPFAQAYQALEAGASGAPWRSQRLMQVEPGGHSGQEPPRTVLEYSFEEPATSRPRSLDPISQCRRFC